MLLQSWISPKTEKNKPSKIHGQGFFATQPIKKDEVIAIKAGHIINRQTLESNREIIKDSEMEIADGIYLAPMTDEEMPNSMIYFNHSCEPSVGFGGNILLVAMRDIVAGEELTTDYAMHFTDPDYKLECSCGRSTCRNTISGNDWKIPELQNKYVGYFSWYIDRKIKAEENQKE